MESSDNSCPKKHPVNRLLLYKAKRLLEEREEEEEVGNVVSVGVLGKVVVISMILCRS